MSFFSKSKLPPKPVHKRPRSRFFKFVLWTLGVLVLVCTVLLVLWLRSLTAYVFGFEPPAMAAARYSSRAVVGDLGGVAVTIPSHFANFVEYDGDPGWGEKRKGPRPERTHQSKLISFGYYTRFPDMAGESSRELIKDRSSYPNSRTAWISVGITTGSIYPGDGFLDRIASYIGKKRKFPSTNSMSNCLDNCMV